MGDIGLPLLLDSYTMLKGSLFLWRHYTCILTGLVLLNNNMCAGILWDEFHVGYLVSYCLVSCFVRFFVLLFLIKKKTISIWSTYKFHDKLMSQKYTYLNSIII